MHIITCFIMTFSHIYIMYFLHVNAPIPLLVTLLFQLVATLFPVSQLFHIFHSFVITDYILLGFLIGLWEKDYLDEYGLPISGCITSENGYFLQ